MNSTYKSFLELQPRNSIPELNHNLPTNLGSKMKKRNIGGEETNPKWNI